MVEIKKAVIPAGGLGTRFLPATKAQPKEMLPIVDKPAIQYVVEEAVESGIDDIVIITGKNKRAIEDHFDRAFELEYYLAKQGNHTSLKEIKRISELASVHYIRQKEPRGLGDAIYCAKKYIGEEPFAILLGDDIIHAKVPCTRQLIEVYKKYQTPVIGVEEIERKNASMYGIIKIGKRVSEKIYEVAGLVEKPLSKHAPSNLAIIGRYILTPDIFDALSKVKIEGDKELQLTDGLNKVKRRIYALKFDGKRYDIGNKLGYIKTVIEFALHRDEMGLELKKFMKDILCSQHTT